MPEYFQMARPLEEAFLRGDEDQLVDELRKVSRQKPRRRGGIVIRILEETNSPRVRNAAALALADMRMKRAKDKLIDVLKRPDTKGYRGTILYALDELGVNLPLSLLVDLLIQDTYEAREEALGFLGSGKIDCDEDLNRLRQKLRASLQSADEERSHAVNTALQYLSASE
jgi:HEAT repeat protein